MEPTETTDITVEILGKIQDELKATKRGVEELSDSVGERFAKVDERFAKVDERFDEMENTVRRLVAESEIRLATAITGHGETLEDIRTLLVDRAPLKSRVDDHERRITKLERERGR